MLAFGKFFDGVAGWPVIIVKRFFPFFGHAIKALEVGFRLAFGIDHQRFICGVFESIWFKFMFVLAVIPIIVGIRVFGILGEFKNWIFLKLLLDFFFQSHDR